MNIFNYFKEKRNAKKQAVETLEKNQERYNRQIDAVNSKAEELKKSNQTTFTDFHYGPEGPTQQCWNTTQITDNCIIEYNHITDQEEDKEYYSYTCLFNNGEFAYLQTNQDKQINNLVVKDSKGIFKEVNIADLPLEGCKLTADQLLDVVNSFQKTNERQDRSVI